MDSHGNIYSARDVSPEDRARLDGYLRGREEQQLISAERIEALQMAERLIELERLRAAVKEQ